MLDYFAIFTKGGALLWTLQLAALKGSPVDALVRTCLLEERGSDFSFSYTPPGGTPYSLKWSFHNGLGLVFVAVYQKALKLLYVEQMLEAAKQAFVVKHYAPRTYRYPAFDAEFTALLKEAEAQAEAARRPKQTQPQKGGSRKAGAANQRKASSAQDSESDGSGGGGDPDEAAHANGANGQPAKHKPEGTALDGGAAENAKGPAPIDVTAGSQAEGGDGAFNVELLAKLGKRGKAGPKARAKAPEPAKPKKSPEKKEKKKAARTWAEQPSSPTTLDFSASPDAGAAGDASETMRNGGIDPASQAAQRSLVDEEDEVEEDEEEDISSDEGDDATEDGTVTAVAEKAGRGGLLASFVRSVGVSIGGTAALSRDDIAPALDALKRKLMERNVAEPIADKVVESVSSSLEGQALQSFTRVSTAVRAAVEDALTRILTPKRSIDILREVHAAKAKGRPYTIVFVGVNGVGKSTNLAKIAYWLLQNDITVMIAACDTFRSGAVEQLKTHCTRLGVPLYERGYEKDPAKVAFEAVKAAQRAQRDVVLVDTAGRMQDNEPLMRALSNLINLNSPDLVLFVGEALVGNDAVDQLSKFNQRLADLAAVPNPHVIDGIVLTKMDAIDDKVGAALSMVYTSGAPIMFVGCGQTYVDLKRLNVKSVVRSLLK